MKPILKSKIRIQIILMFVVCFISFKMKAGEAMCCTPMDSFKKATIECCETLDGVKNNTFSVGENIVIKVNRIDSLVTINKEKGLYLWINGVCYPNVKFQLMDIACNKLYFKLVRDTSKTSPWNILFPSSYYLKNPKDIGISIGTKDNILTNCYPVFINTTKEWMSWFGYPLILLLLTLVFFLYDKLLRDSPPFSDSQQVMVLTKIKLNNEPLSEREIYNTELPFSLSRFQLLFWTVLVTISIIYIWIYTGDFVSPSTTVLLLLGISGGTNLIGRTIDNDKAKQANVALADQLTVKQFHDKGYASKGLFIDMLSDENGISVHRFQLLLFTIVLGIYFLWQVISNLGMPDFSSTLLLLMGISSTTYAGIKITEK